MGKGSGLKGQKLIAQGIALGRTAWGCAPCKGKSIVVRLRLLPFQGAISHCEPTQGDALSWMWLAFQAVALGWMWLAFQAVAP